MSLLDESSETLYVSGSIFDTETVIAVQEDYFPSVLSVNGQVGHVTISGLTDGYNLNNIFYTTGNQTVSGIKNFDSRPNFSGVGLATINELSGITGYLSSPIKKFTFNIPTGNNIYTGTFPESFSTIPTIINSIESTGAYQYLSNINYVDNTGFIVILSDIITESGVKLNIVAY